MNQLSYKQNKETDVLFYVHIIILALFAFNFKNLYNYIMLAWVGFTCLMYSNFKVPVYKELIVLCITFVLYLFSYGIITEYTIQIFSYYLVAPIFCYLFGFNMMRKNTEKRFFTIVYVIIWALFIHGMLTTINHIASGSIERNPVDISAGHVIPATLHGFFLTMMVSILYYVLFVNKNWFYKILHLSAIGFCIYATLFHASRTLLIVAVAVFVIAAIYHAGTKSKKRALKIIVCLIIVAIVCVALFNSNAFGIKSVFEKTNFNERITEDNYRTLAEDGRIERTIIVLDNAWKYPFSGMSNEVNRYAHNLWFDTIRTVGYIPAFFLILYTVYVFSSFYKFLKRKSIPQNMKIMMLSLYLGVYLNFMVEPVLEGYPMLFSLTCILNGMVKSIINSADFKEIEE